MSDSTYVFVETNQSLETFIVELGEFLNLSFQRREKATDIWYDFDSEQISIWVYEHEYESDQDLPFADYPLAIDVRAKLVQVSIGKRAWQDEQTRQIFQKLKDTKKYRLLLVWDLQQILEQFEPGNNEQHSPEPEMA